MSRTTAESKFLRRRAFFFEAAAVLRLEGSLEVAMCFVLELITTMRIVGKTRRFWETRLHHRTCSGTGAWATDHMICR